MVENRELILEVVFVTPDADSDDDQDLQIETENGSILNLYERMDTTEQHINASSTCSATSGRSSTTSEPQQGASEETVPEKTVAEVH
jgi:hypothetical protein